MKKLSERAKKRIRIAKDVLLQLKEGTLKPAHVYTELSGTNKSIEDLKRGTDLQKVFKNKKCNVCAIGSLFVAKVRRYNEAKTQGFTWDNSVSQFINQPQIHTNLKGIFTQKQLILMEQIYERAGQLSYEHSDYYYDKKGNPISDKKRMEMIMQNIIKNGGTFRP